MSTLSRSNTGLGEKPPVVLSQVPLKLKKTEKIEFIQPCLKLMNVQNILTLFEPLNPTLQWLSIIGMAIPVVDFLLEGYIIRKVFD